MVAEIARARLRTREAYAAIREAAITVLRHEAFHIVHLSIQGTHVHLLVEAANREALSRGMQAVRDQRGEAHQRGADACGELVGAAHRARGRAAPEGPRVRGPLSRGDHHEAEAGAAMRSSYVLNNWRKHREDRGERSRAWVIDPYATGWAFEGWKERGGLAVSVEDARGVQADPRVAAGIVAVAGGLAALRIDRHTRGAELAAGARTCGRDDEMNQLELAGQAIRTIYDVLEVVRVRPGMWIGNPSVTSLQVFLSGFRAGIDAAHASLEIETPPFREFHEWIASRLGMRMNGKGWATMLREAHRSEVAALEQFWLELDAFRSASA